MSTIEVQRILSMVVGLLGRRQIGFPSPPREAQGARNGQDLVLIKG
jgi:hypothetical protein